MVRPSYSDKLNVKRGLRTTEEDPKVVNAYVSKQGIGNASGVPMIAGRKRFGKSCRVRWSEYHSPVLNHENFSSQEEELIVKLHATIGSRWSIIAQQLPGRTDIDVKNYWNTKLRKKLKEMGIDPVTHKPYSQLLSEYGNISALPRSGPRQSSLNRDLKNVVMLKSEHPGAAMVPEFSSINNHFMTEMIPYNVEPILAQNSFISSINYDNVQSLDLLSQLQAINLATEASTQAITEINSIPAQITGETFSISSQSSSSSPTRSYAPLGTSQNITWSDFLLDDASMPAEQQTQDNNVDEFSPKDSSNYIHNNATLDTMNDPVNELHCGFSTIGFKDSTTYADKSFVEAMLNRESEMLLDFPYLSDEPFDF